MHLKPLTDGSVTGTGTLTLGTGQKLGGVLISTDGVNAATVIIRRTNNSGYQLFKLVTVNSIFAVGPIEAAASIYYDISGTNAAAQMFEWVPKG